MFRQFDTVRLILFAILLLVTVAGPALGQPYGTIGGDDIEILSNRILDDPSMDVASNGDIYLATTFETELGNREIAIYRSQDGGTTWDLWGQVGNGPGGTNLFVSPCLKVVEGTVSRCFVAYNVQGSSFRPRILMVSADLADATANFGTPTLVMSSIGEDYYYPRFDTDVSNFSSFFIYLTAYSSVSGGGNDIYFTRSTDQGASFETPYKIGDLAPTDRSYKYADVSYGFGGNITVAWHFLSEDGGFDMALRYRHATSYAGGGISDWGSIYGLGSISDGVDYRNPRIEASKTTTDVVLAFERYSSSPDWYRESCVYHSTDSGASFPVSFATVGEFFPLGEILEQPLTGNWYVGGIDHGMVGIRTAHVSDLTSWSTREVFSDAAPAGQAFFESTIALNPAEGYAPCMAWTEGDYPEDDKLFFDGGWRDGTGYPNLEEGFPVQLPSQSLSAPAVVDVNGDGDLEIVFGDSSGRIQVFQHDGTPLPGWPVDVGEALSEGPVAVGDLQGNGIMSLVVGTESGRVYRYEADGTPGEGNWPFHLGDDSPAYVAIGAFGLGPYPRGIVVHVGTHGYFVDHKGNLYPGTSLRTMAQSAAHAPAIGDVDGDGLPDAVFAQQGAIAVTAINHFEVIFGKYLGADISGSPTLADFDLDGDVEVVVPLADGTLHLFDDTGTDLPGFPFISSTGYELRSAALANLLGDAVPEIAVAARNYKAHLVSVNGTETTGYPVGTDGWANYGGAIVGVIEGASPEIILGSRGQKAWSWNNFGSVNPGWPKALDFNVYETPAMGDIDLDGSTEIVFLNTNQLVVVDVNHLDYNSSLTWPMEGYDPQRTGCYQCPEDVVTPVVDDEDGITRVSFAAPSPNPSSGSATFRFAVPGPAVVNLEVFNVRGHRVSLVTREEVGAGHHVVSWGGLNDRGESLASGIYFARLRVEGPGIREMLTRKITLAR